MNSTTKILLLFIPSIIFAGVLFFLLTRGEADVNITNRALQPFATSAPDKNTPTPTPQLPTTVTINEDIVVLAKLADTTEERRIGLSQTGFLPENEGMLFDFSWATGDEARPAFWMKDMTIPIDIIWIADGKISQIHKNIQPEELGTPDRQLKLYVPNDPIDYVLEVNAGFSDENNLQIGDPVDF